MGIATKNLQSEENIKRMAAAARPGVNVTGIKELTEGLCNVAYDISWEDGTSSILKIASSDRSHNNFQRSCSDEGRSESHENRKGELFFSCGRGTVL